ncbi:MAG: MoxR family ATPase [Spirochaetales bacterium]|nr:MoxR family ATPase [Spirochaetales bacterium]
MLDQERINNFAQQIENAVDEAQKVISGNRESIQKILATIICGGHALLEGVPGTGKTFTASSISQVLDLDFKRIQFTPDLMPADITGTTIFDRNTSDFHLRKGPIFTDILLADEINRAPAKTQAALLEAMQEKKVTIDTETNQLSSFFTCLATQNPVEMEGTYPLPEAEIDRFLMKITIGYPDADAEKEIIRRYRDGEISTVKANKLTKIIDRQLLSEIKEAVDKVNVEENILDYITEIVRKTRDHKDVELGASPRSSVALFSVARTIALMSGRDFVIPDDVKANAISVLAHRLILTTEAQITNIDNASIIQEIIDTTEVPK